MVQISITGIPFLDAYLLFVAMFLINTAFLYLAKKKKIGNDSAATFIGSTLLSPLTTIIVVYQYLFKYKQIKVIDLYTHISCGFNIFGVAFIFSNLILNIIG